MPAMEVVADDVVVVSVTPWAAVAVDDAVAVDAAAVGIAADWRRGKRCTPTDES